MKEIINITEIMSYLYCPRKVYLKRVLGFKEPPTPQMISGRLKHEVFDLFNKNESSWVSGINKKLEENEILFLYNSELNKIINEAVTLNSSLLLKFQIPKEKFSEEIRKFMKKEIDLRIKAVKETLNLGFLGRELWFNLKPKYLTEFQILSYELGLKGRIDRVEVGQEILPFEIKTRQEIYETDKIQLAGYALLLEKEFGKEIKKGIVETQESREEVFLDEELKNKVLETAEKIRIMEKEPEFGNNFNKCRNCRLKNECFE